MNFFSQRPENPGAELAMLMFSAVVAMEF